MTKEEFLQEAALRLITAKPAANMADVACWALDLTERIYPSSEVPEIASGKCDRNVSTASVMEIVRYVKKQPYGRSYSMRIEKAFISNGIKTIGDLLHRGHREFKYYRNVGHGSIVRIEDALESLYNIKSW